MSSTSGSQNLLTNIFRPAYRYEIPVGGTTAVFVPTLDVSNIDVLTANSVTAFTAAIGDENENVYVGSNAGNAYSNLRGCSNNTAVGYAAAGLVSNVANSVYIGYNAGAGAADSSVNIAIGPNTKGNGVSNIYIGSNTGSLGTGVNNILIGHNLTGSNLSNTLLIGPTPTIYGNLSTRKVGIGRDPSYNMDISGDARITYRLGVGMAPGTAENVSNVPHAIDISGYSYFKGGVGINADPADFTFNVNGSFRAADGFGSMTLQQDGCGNSVLTCRPDTTDVSGRKFILNIAGDICATSIRIPGGDFSGNVTASNLIALADLSGPTARITNIFGNTIFGTDVSGTTARFTSLFAGTFNPASVTTTAVSVGDGTVSTPSITFSNDISSGVYLASASNIAFTTAGVERMRISNTHVGIGTGIPRSALDVSTNIRAGTPGNTTNTARLEVGGGYVGDGASSTNSYPTLAFQYGDAAGGYRHFIRSRHQPALTSFSNAIDIFTNNSSNATASSAPATNNLLAMSITSGGVGVGTSNPGVALDVSGAIRGTAATSNSIGGVTLSNTNISNAGTTTSSNFIGTSNASNSIGGVTLNNSNISNAATVTSVNFIGTSTASNSIGGVTLNNSNISNAGTTTSSNFIGTSTASNSIGGVTLNNSNISNAATVTSVNFIGTSTASNQIGGVTLNNGVISNLGTTNNSIGGVTLCNGTAIGSFQGPIILTSNAIGNQTTTSNSLGGVTLSNSIVAAATAVRDALTPSTYDISTGGMRASNVVLNATATGYIRNAPTSWTFDISGGNIMYNGSICNSTTNTSNLIGGVILSNSNVIASGAFRNAASSWNIDISSGNISNSGTIVSTGGFRNDVASWTIDISRGNIVYGGAITGSASNTSNLIGGVTLNNNNISNTGTTTSSNFIGNSAASNQIGGVTLNSSNISNALTVTASNFIGNSSASNQIGGVTLNNTNVSNVNGLTASNVVLSNTANGFIRNAATSWTTDISTGVLTGNIVLTNSNTGFIRNAATGWTMDISRGNIDASGISVSNIVLSNNTTGFIRNAATGWTIDISRGNIVYNGAITNSAVTTSNLIGGVTLNNSNVSNVNGLTASNVVLSNTANGFIRNAASSWTTDISTGVLTRNIVTSNIVLSNTPIGLGFIRNAATAWTTDISSGNITYGGSIFNSNVNTSNLIGGVTLSNGVISNSGTTNNSIGGVTLNNGVISNSGTTNNTIGGVTLNNGAISNLSTTINSIGGVTLCNGNINGTFQGAIAISNAVIGGYVRNNLTPGEFDISGGRIRSAVGAVSNPAFGAITDPSSGIYFPQSNTVAISTAGRSYMCVSSTLVGMGTLNPQARLHLRASNEVGALANVPYEMLRLEWTDEPGAAFNQLPGHGTKISFYTVSNDITGATTEGAYIGAVRANGFENDLTTDFVVNTRLNGTTGVTERLRYITASNRFDVSGDISGNRYLGTAGVVSNPTYAFVTDPSAGLYLPAVSNLGFTIAGRERMRIDSNGNVGLGRTDPNSLIRLDVSGRVRILADGSTSLTSWGLNNNADTLVLQHTGDYTTAADVGKSASILFANATCNFPQARIASEMLSVTPAGFNSSLVFQIGSGAGLAERMRITSSGTVGIGTSVPLAPLDVFNGGIVMNRIGNITANTDVSAIVEGSCNVGLYWQKGSNNNNCGVSFRTLANNVFAERMRIDGNTGNVGIGTTAPVASLDVSATFRVTCNTTALFDVIPSGGYATTSTNGYFAIYAAGTTDKAASNTVVSLASDTGGNHIFMRSTRIGVGTSNPQVPLDVSGTLRVNGGSGTANTRIVLGPSPSSGNLDYASVIQSTPNTTGNFGSTLSFWTHDGVLSAAEPLQRMTIDNAGRVGIGTTAPTEQLEVTQTTSGNTSVSANVLIWAGAGGVSGTSNRANLIFRVRGAGGGDVTSILRSELDNGSGTYGISVLDGAGAGVARFDVTNRRVGVGTFSPGAALDVSGSAGSTSMIVRSSDTATNILRLQTNNVKTGQSNVISFEGTDSGTATGPLASIAAIDVATGVQGYRGEVAIRTTNGANNTLERMRVNYLGNVGVGLSNPAYRLDVTSDATSNASINMSTWPRMSTTSNFFWVRGINTLVGSNIVVPNSFNSRIRWNTTNSNAINANIMSWTDSATNGSSFTINRSGIWSINFYVITGGTTLYTTWLDVSTSAATGWSNNTSAGSGELLAISQSSNSTTISFVGYLGSNASRHYRMCTNSTSLNTQANLQSYLTVALLYETPNIAPTFP